MAIRIRKLGQQEEKEYQSEVEVKQAIEQGVISGEDEYFVPKENSWAPIDQHPRMSTTDARGVYPVVVHLVIFIKILVFVGFLAVLDNRVDILTSWGSLYVYAIIVADGLCLMLVYLNLNRFAAWLLWFFGLASFPLGLFLIISGGMTRTYKYRPAE
jgi:hypothetical protein